MVLYYDKQVVKITLLLGKEKMSDTRWLSVDEIAEHLGGGRETIYAWIEKRELPAHRVGRLWKFQKEDVDNWVKSGKAADIVDKENQI